MARRWDAKTGSYSFANPKGSLNNNHLIFGTFLRSSCVNLAQLFEARNRESSSRAISDGFHGSAEVEPVLDKYTDYRRIPPREGEFSDNAN